jgi:O-antigen/teichoic acid export membrane protein
MGRQNFFFSSLIAGYFSSAANLAYTAISVPLALHYLSKEEFGLWALVVQIGGYLMLLDLGMSSSVARFLADHKDEVNGRSYGDVIETGKVFFWIQALLLAVAGLACAAWGPKLLGIPGELTTVFQRVVFFYVLILALGLALRIKSAPLWAHQRTDIGHWSTMANLCSALGVMGLGFFLGWGTYSFLAGAFAGTLWSSLLPWAACRRLKLLPERNLGSRFCRKLFVRMLGFGRDVLMMQLGGLLCAGSQIILVTKLFGLETAAVFSVATKTLAMGQQLIGRILESAAPGLTELFVRGERDRFSFRFYQMSTLSVALATFAGIALMATNREFIGLWTHGKVVWNRGGDVLIGALLISNVASRCFQGVFGMTGDLAKVRYLSLLEGLIFVGCVLGLKGWGGVCGILGAALATNFFVSGLGGCFQASRVVPVRGNWQTKLARLLVFYFLMAGAYGWAIQSFSSLLARVTITLILLIGCGFSLVRKMRSTLGQAI